MNYLTCNDTYVKCKNKWRSQRIHKQCKNRHHFRYSDIDKKNCRRKNRIATKKTSNITDITVQTKSSKKRADISTKNYYKVSVDISLINNENKVINIPDSQYKIMKYQLQNATIHVSDRKQQNHSYLSYAFIPCNTYYSRDNIDTMYQKQNDLDIPLFVDRYNKVKYNLIDLYNDYNIININKPFCTIAQECLDQRNVSEKSHYSMPYNWNVSNVDTNDNRVCVTVSTTVIMDSENDCQRFVKSRPFTKKQMSAFDIFDSVLKQKLRCALSQNTYVNVPILFNSNAFQIQSVAFDENGLQISDIYNRFQAIMEEQKRDSDSETETEKYWFCPDCFVMNIISNMKTEKHIYKCDKCSTQAQERVNVYYKKITDMCLQNVALSKREQNAVNYVNKYSKKAGNASKSSLLNKIQKLGITRDKQGIYDKLVDFMSNKVPIIIHIRAKELIPKLLKDTHYKNLFEIGTGNGCTNKQTRSKFENEMFPNVYKNASNKEKPKYGCLNTSLATKGCKLAYQYGTAYFRLNDESVRWRVSYTNQDSFAAKGNLATLSNCQHLLNGLSDSELDELIKSAMYDKVGGVKQSAYREIQVHGPVLLKRDIKSLHIPKNEKSNAKMYEQFAQRNECELLWF